jgi:hypothetical protein
MSFFQTFERNNGSAGQIHMTATNDKNWLFKSFNTTTPDKPGFSNHLTSPHQTCQCCTSPTSFLLTAPHFGGGNTPLLLHTSKQQQATTMMMIPALFIFISLLSHVISLSLPSHHCLTLTATSLSSHCHLIIIKPPAPLCHLALTAISPSTHSHSHLFVFISLLSPHHVASSLSLPSHHCLTLTVTSLSSSHCHLIIIKQPPAPLLLLSHSHCHLIIDSHYHSLSQPPLCCLPSHCHPTLTTASFFPIAI